MSDILGRLIVKIATDAANLSSGLDSAQSKMAGVAQKMTSVGKDMSLAVTAPLVAMGGVAIKAASDLSESANKVQVVFGDQATAIQSWAAKSATALGQSKQQALEAVGTFGNLFSAMGIGQQQSAQMSTSLIELASDLASFNNIDPTLALEKLRAGLVGETEPLRTLGVNLSAAAVQAKAMEMGLASSTKEITPAISAQAAYALILEQTKTAQGDFARTSDGLANSSRIMKAQLTDAAATMGQHLLPIALKVVQGLNGMLESFNNLSPAAQKTILVIAGIAAAIGPVLVVAGTLISSVITISGAFSAMMPVLSAAGAAIAALGGPVTIIIGVVVALAAAWSTNFLGIRDITYSAIGAARDFIGGAINAIRGFFSGSWSDIGARMMQGIADGIRGAWNWVVDAARGAASAALNAAKSALGISSPSKVAAEQIGRPVAQGIGLGYSQEMERQNLHVESGLNAMLGRLRPAAAADGGGRLGSLSIPITINISGNGDAMLVGRAAQTGIMDALRQAGLA